MWMIMYLFECSGIISEIFFQGQLICEEVSISAFRKLKYVWSERVNSTNFLAQANLKRVLKILDNLQSEFLTNWSASGFVQRRRSRYSSVVQAALTEERPILTMAPAIEKTSKILVSHFSKGSKLKGRYICGLYQMWLLNSEHVRSHVYISMDKPAEPPSDRDNDPILSFDNVADLGQLPK